MCLQCNKPGLPPADSFAEISQAVRCLLTHPACTAEQRAEAQRHLCAGSTCCGLAAYRDALLTQAAAWEEAQLAAESAAWPAGELLAQHEAC